MHCAASAVAAVAGLCIVDSQAAWGLPYIAGSVKCLTTCTARSGLHEGCWQAMGRLGVASSVVDGGS
jgi:hypothetical protein